MVFDKQHLSLFVALAFLLVYANALPTSALSNEKNVERLRGDLHSFIEMIISCLANTKYSRHSKADPSQMSHFKQIANDLQEDVGLDDQESPEKARKFDADTGHDTEESSSEVSPPGENESSSESNEGTNNNSKETSESNATKESTSDPGAGQESEEIANRREFDVPNGETHGYTPRTVGADVTDMTSAEKTAPPSTTSTSASTEDQQTSSESGEDENPTPSNEPKEKSESGRNNYKPKHAVGERKKYRDESSPNNSNESKDKLENNTEEIQVRNLIQDAPEFASDSSVHPYEALHIYGIRENGPINKIVFEGGEHHPPRPLTVRESKQLKEFIKMILKNNKVHSPIASFPVEDNISSRSGFYGKYAKKSPWADKPVPVELV